MVKEMSQRLSPSRLSGISVCVKERERGEQGEWNINRSRKNHANVSMHVWMNCTAQIALSCTHIALTKSCFGNDEIPRRLWGFFFVTTLSPPLKSVDEVRARKPQLSSQFRSVSCFHPRHLPLPSTQTSRSILCNFKNKVTKISSEESKMERKGKEDPPPSSLFAYAHNAMGRSRQSRGENEQGQTNRITEPTASKAYKCLQTQT